MLMDKILICAPIRQKLEILQKYLKSLDNLEIADKEMSIDSYFILHNCYEELHNCFSPETILLKFDDDSIDVRNDNITHDWKIDNFKAIVHMKNRIKDFALKNKFDYIFMVDSDLILHPKTLLHLYSILKSTNEKVIGEVFYTDWDKSGKLLPNAWDMDSYSFMTDPRTRYKKENVDLYQVGGTGACILIDTKIFENPSINYNPIQNITFSSWEDRAFCIRCYVNDIKVFLDTKYPCEHLYHDK